MRRREVTRENGRDARGMHFAQQKRTISRRDRTDHVSDTVRTYRKGKRHVAGYRAGFRAR